MTLRLKGSLPLGTIQMSDPYTHLALVDTSDAAVIVKSLVVSADATVDIPSGKTLVIDSFTANNSARLSKSGAGRLVLPGTTRTARQNWALGVSGDEEPVLHNVTNTSANKLTLKLGDYQSAAQQAVTYSLYSATDKTALSSATTPDQTSTTSSSFEVTIPTDDDSSVHYYKIEYAFP